MRKLIFAFVALIMASGCSVNDDTPNTSYELAEITGNDLPENFAFGETYTVKVNYALRSECNTFAGVDAQRASSSGDERRQIYVGVVSIINEGNCDTGVPGATGSSNFSITIDEREDYTFYFWTGTDSENEPVYTEVVVPVIEGT